MTLDEEKLIKRGFIPRSLSLYDRHALQEPFRILQDQRVNQINEIYRNKKDLCRRVARQFYIDKADFERRKTSGEKVNQEADPWPFEIDETVESGMPLKPKREWEWPRDAEAIHVFLMLFRDTKMPADPILTAEIRAIYPQLVLHHSHLYSSSFLRRDMESLLAYAAEDKKFQNKLSKDSKQLTEADQKIKQENPTEYSRPLSMVKWGDILGYSRNKMYELRDQETYHFELVSKRRWKLPLHELPSEYLEQYRQVISKIRSKSE